MSNRPDKYTVIKKLGDAGGGCNGGILIVCKRGDPRSRLVEKKFDVRTIREGFLRREVTALRQLRHDNIVQRLDSFMPNTITASIWFEYCDGGDMGHLIEKHAKARTPIPEVFLWKVFVQIAEALKYCHYGPAGGTDGRWNIWLHCDMKPNNILFKRGNDRLPDAKLADFGCVQVLSHDNNGQTLFPFGATPEFGAPERPTYWARTDVYGLGTSIYCAMFRAPIPRMPTAYGNTYSGALSYAVSACRRTNPDNRPSSRDLPDYLRQKQSTVRDLPPADGLLLLSSAI